jgi:hypothetical protein
MEIMPLADRVILFEQDLQVLLRKYHLKMNVQIPDEMQLALMILKKQGVNYRMTYTEENK